MSLSKLSGAEFKKVREKKSAENEAQRKRLLTWLTKPGKVTVFAFAIIFIFLYLEQYIYILYFYILVQLTPPRPHCFNRFDSRPRLIAKKAPYN